MEVNLKKKNKDKPHILYFPMAKRSPIKKQIKQLQGNPPPTIRMPNVTDFRLFIGNVILQFLFSATFQCFVILTYRNIQSYG